MAVLNKTFLLSWTFMDLKHFFSLNYDDSILLIRKVTLKMCKCKQPLCLMPTV